MRITFEPGDGSFEITLGPNEQLPKEWNVKGVTVMKWTKDRQLLQIVKPVGYILDNFNDVC